ncbi:MAG: hypothetical protein A4E66_00672 [Syntrophus sp. PtaB.Bin001]|nr:MAG: hypothetical protein A4E66_00672 [Syntrophus sp. PtaB.Bin001]
MENGELMLVSSKQDVSDEIIAKLPNFKAALKLCKDISGLNDQQVCMALNMDPAQWSRIWTDKAHFPSEKIPCLMDICGNEVPLKWLAMKRGYELKPTQTVLERENDHLRDELEKLKIEMNAVKKFMREIRVA